MACGFSLGMIPNRGFFCDTATGVFPSRCMKINVVFHYRGLQCEGNITLYFLCSYFIHLRFSSCRAPTPPLIQPRSPSLKKNYLLRPAYSFQELYYAYKLDLDCITNLVDYSVIQEISLWVDMSI